MITTLDKFTDSMSNIIMDVSMNDIHYRIALAGMSDLDETSNFANNAMGILSKHFVMCCKQMNSPVTTAIIFMIKIVRVIQGIEEKYGISTEDSLLNRLNENLIRDTYKPPQCITGDLEADMILCWDELNNKQIPLVSCLFDEIKKSVSESEDEIPEEEQVRWMLINFFIILSRIEEAIRMEKGFGL